MADVIEVDELERFTADSGSVMRILSRIIGMARTDLPVLVLGETGYYKELTARMVHELSLRKSGPFVTGHCAATPESSLEMELFGYGKGVLPGARPSSGGRIEQADGGTLFLDRIAELPARLQSKLWRFLDDREVRITGGGERRKVDVRVIAGADPDIDFDLFTGRLHPDLYHRLNGFTVQLVPFGDDVNQWDSGNHSIEMIPSIPTCSC